MSTQTAVLNNHRRNFTVLYVIILLTALQLFIALLTDGFALSQDEGMWHYIGRNWFRNRLVPYSGGADNKSPLFYALFGLSDKLFGVNYWFPRVVGTLCQSLGLWFLYKTARLLAGRQAGILTISFYGLSVLWKSVDGKFVSYDETYEVTFIIASFYFLLGAKNKQGDFISGFLAAIGLCFRLTAIFGIGALFTSAIRKKGFAALSFSAGGLAGVLSGLLAAHLAGINLRDLYTFMLADNFGAGSTTDHGLIFRTIQFCNLFFFSEVILFYPLLIAYLFISKKADWLIVWLLSVFVGINLIGNYARVDLKEILPAMSLAAGLTAIHFINKYNLPLNKILIIIWVCFFPKSLESVFVLTVDESVRPDLYCKEPYIQPDDKAVKALGEWIKASTKPQQKVFVAGFSASVQAYSERVSPTIYFNATQTQIAKKRFYEDMKQCKAEMILVPLFPSYKQYIDAGLRAYIDQLAARDYVFDRCMFSYAVYRLKK
ncbi:MAG TPA: glycosyltransferase family 39 protein [Mucilaginibacter sp.]